MNILIKQLQRYCSHQRLQQLALSTMLATVLAIGLVGNTQANNKIQVLDQIIVIVDDDVVLASELHNRIEQITQNITKNGQTPPPIEELKQEILNQLILENIQRQMAYRAGVRISDAQLNESMSRIASQNQMTLLQFKEALESDGRSYTNTREQIRQDLMLQRVQQGNVNQRIQITDQEITNFLASEEGRSLTAPEYRMLHTLLPVASGANAETIAAAKKRAEQIHQRIERGENYESLLNKNTQLTTTDLGWRKATDLPSLLSGLAATLSEGETATPVQSPSGFHLVKLLKKRGEGELIAQTKARHILLKPSAIRDENATEALANNLRQRVLEGEDFAELAREYSEDIGSALEGGDLGWTQPGQLVAAFQKSMDSADINEISPPFRSQYGWHILQVMERRDKDVTDNIRRNIARNHIHKRKFDDELQAWLQKIRDEAYVDFK